LQKKSVKKNNSTEIYMNKGFQLNIDLHLVKNKEIEIISVVFFDIKMHKKCDALSTAPNKM
jgi:hypothetical protein